LIQKYDEPQKNPRAMNRVQTTALELRCIGAV
jgi:hypothetical protein